ncbi:MAG: hypothetical protein M1569_01480 [Candidatus Marsarchaeota archaeon]|nr:hypothetical protein [Candidatus Marsarchaeota archaeon]MCL5413054.1 hypothetical protein [Candidatus Marsarchaeota archaeon]
MAKKIYVLMLACYDSPVTYNFSTRAKADAFAKRYVSRYGWSIKSYTLDPKKVSKDDEMWFLNTPGGKALQEREEKERAIWRAREAKKTPLDELMERLDAHISVNTTNAKQDVEVLRSLKKQIKELVDEKHKDGKAKL